LAFELLQTLILDSGLELDKLFRISFPFISLFMNPISLQPYYSINLFTLSTMVC